MTATRADVWIEAVETNSPKYLKDVSDATIRKRLSLARLESRGRIQLNASGDTLVWPVQFAEPAVTPYTSGIVTYTQRHKHKQAGVDTRGYIVTDEMTEKERLENRGDSVIVDRYQKMLPDLVKAMRNRLGKEFYVDGYASGNEQSWCGLESMMGQGTTVVADICGDPDDTYAGISTNTAQSGTWTADLTTKPNAHIAYDWPEGTGDAEFDYWSPKLFNWSSTTWTGYNTWSTNGEEVISRMHQTLTNTSGFEGPPDSCVMASALMTQLKTKLRADRIIPQPHQEANDLGFPDVINYEGMALWTEYGVTANAVYMYRTEDIDLIVLQDELLKGYGPFFDENTMSYKFNVCNFSNLKFNCPRNFAKASNYAAS
jgi:hypothetical protein